MIDRSNLLKEYKQALEERIITYLSEKKELELRVSMDIYYRSKLAKLIAGGIYGVENLDYKYLAQDLIDNEPELFD
jgi:hypothetical protein